MLLWELRRAEREKRRLKCFCL